MNVSMMPEIQRAALAVSVLDVMLLGLLSLGLSLTVWSAFRGRSFAGPEALRWLGVLALLLICVRLSWSQVQVWNALRSVSPEDLFRVSGGDPFPHWVLAGPAAAVTCLLGAVVARPLLAFRLGRPAERRRAGPTLWIVLGVILVLHQLRIGVLTVPDLVDTQGGGLAPYIGSDAEQMLFTVSATQGFSVATLLRQAPLACACLTGLALAMLLVGSRLLLRCRTRVEVGRAARLVAGLGILALLTGLAGGAWSAARDLSTYDRVRYAWVPSDFEHMPWGVAGPLLIGSALAVAGWLVSGLARGYHWRRVRCGEALSDR